MHIVQPIGCPKLQPKLQPELCTNQSTELQPKLQPELQPELQPKPQPKLQPKLRSYCLVLHDNTPMHSTVCRQLSVLLQWSKCWAVCA